MVFGTSWVNNPTRAGGNGAGPQPLERFGWLGALQLSLHETPSLLCAWAYGSFPCKRKTPSVMHPSIPLKPDLNPQKLCQIIVLRHPDVKLFGHEYP
jgi:hypothetical protein